MATRAVLAELCAAYAQRSGREVQMQSVGGVDAARRVQAGEVFDVVLLASEAIDKLIASGHLLPGSRVDLVLSPVAVAVRAGAAQPDIHNETAVRQAVLAARSIVYSTGPSGVYLNQLFERWGVAGLLRERTVQVPPGVPVGALLADGRAEIGFQQLSELMHLPGITVLGTLPPDMAFVTTFSAGLPPACRQPEAVREMLFFMNSSAAAEAKHRHGMTPA